MKNKIMISKKEYKKAKKIVKKYKRKQLNINSVKCTCESTKESWWSFFELDVSNSKCR